MSAPDRESPRPGSGPPRPGSGPPRPAWTAPLLVAAATAVNFGPFVFAKGFYSDDWRFLDLMAGAPAATTGSFWSALNADGLFDFRPLNALMYAIQRAAFGEAAWAYHAALLALDVLGALLAYAAIFTASKRRDAAFLCALLFAVFPNHGATHHWFSSPAALTLCMVLGAAAASMRALERERPLLHAASALLVLAAGLTYEAAAPLVLLLPALGWVLFRRRGASTREAALRACLAAVPCLLAAAAAAAYQHLFIARLFPTGFRRDVAFDPAFAVRVMGRAVECSSTSILDLARRSAGELLWAPAGWLWLAAAAAVIPAALWVWRREVSSEESERRPLSWDWAAGCAALFVACYAPYALSAQRYEPHIFDVQNRVNAAGSLPAAGFLAWLLLAAAARPAARKAAAWAFAGFLAVSTLCNWAVGRQWARAWTEQRRALDAVREAAAALPTSAALVLDLPPPEVGPLPSFDTDWSVDSAVRVATGRRDLQARRADSSQPAAAGARAYSFRVRDGRATPY